MLWTWVLLSLTFTVHIGLSWISGEFLWYHCAFDKRQMPFKYLRYTGYSDLSFAVGIGWTTCIKNETGEWVKLLWTCCSDSYHTYRYFCEPHSAITFKTVNQNQLIDVWVRQPLNHMLFVCRPHKLEGLRWGQGWGIYFCSSQPDTLETWQLRPVRVTVHVCVCVCSHV